MARDLSQMSMDDIVNMSFDDMSRSMQQSHSTIMGSRSEMRALTNGDPIEELTRMMPRMMLSGGRRGTPGGVSYEQLLELDRRNRKRGLSQDMLRKLPVTTLKRSEQKEECQVCKEHFGTQRVMKLPCKHNYHEDCITKWFENNRTCPVCRHELEK